MELTVSVPIEAAAKLAATAAAEPPLEPPGVRDGSYGFLVWAAERTECDAAEREFMKIAFCQNNRSGSSEPVNDSCVALRPVRGERAAAARRREIVGLYIVFDDNRNAMKRTAGT
jgi:hypothetical protein